MPKTKEEIIEAIVNRDSFSFNRFISNYKLRNFRSYKRYEYILDCIQADPKETYIIYLKHGFFYNLFTNNIQFVNSPTIQVNKLTMFHHAIISKSAKFAILKKLNINDSDAIMIDKNMFIKLAYEKIENFKWR